jgi:hypothetical protein
MFIKIKVLAKFSCPNMDNVKILLAITTNSTGMKITDFKGL